MALAQITVELPKGRYVWRVLAVTDDLNRPAETLQIVGPIIFKNGKRQKPKRRKSK